MAKHSKQFTHALKRYLSVGKGQRRKQHWHTKQQQLPDALKCSVLRGEAVFRQQFFAYFEGKGFDDTFSYLAYEKIVNDSHVITEFVQLIGLQDAVESYIQAGVAAENDDYHAQCYQLYCLLIDHLAQMDEEKLLHDASVRLIQHYLPSFLPKADKIKPSLETLQKQCRKALNKQWHCQVTIKESFTTTADSAELKLIAHVDKCHPTELIHIAANRLRSAKFQAYHQLLDALENDEFDKNLIAKLAKKNQPMRSLS